MDPDKPPVRGRARGRASQHRDPPAQQEVPLSPAGHREPGPESSSSTSVTPQDDRYRQMFEESGNGKGGGDGEQGQSQRKRIAGPSTETVGVPRGKTQAPGERERPVPPDYVVSKPKSTDFRKQGQVIAKDNDTQTSVLCNYFPFEMDPKFKFMLYSVKTEPELEEESKVRRLCYRKREEIGTYLLTGRQMFRTMPTPEEVLIFHNVTLRDDSEEQFTLILEFLREVNHSEPVVFQFYNVVARRMQSMLPNMTLLRTHFFNEGQKREFKTWKLELWPGFQNSIRQQERAMLLNVECVWKVVHTESVFEKMNFIRKQCNGEGWQKAIKEKLIGLQVVTIYQKRATRAYRIDDIDFNMNPTHKFKMKDKEVSYIEYFRDRYDTNIRVEKQPMIVVEPRERDIRRGQRENIYLVPELCWPTGLNDELRSNFRLMKDLATCLHMPPSGRVETMKQFIHRVKSNREIDAELKRWGCQVQSDPVKLVARSFGPEELIFAGGRKFRADEKADWTQAMRSEKMLSTARLDKWVVIVSNRESSSVDHLVSTMQKVANPLGYRIERPSRIYKVTGRSYANEVDKAVADFKGDLNMILVILMNNNADVYAEVKKKCSVGYGIPSQCFLAKHLSNTRGLMSICTKLVIQMNAKQGGEPWGATIPLKEMMVLGYDVHHAGPGGGASVGAMTATVNASFGGYYSCVERQTEREEIGANLAKMFSQCLNAYLKKNGSLPKRILMYRDGVGEGQLRTVYEQEIHGFQEKIEEAYKDKEGKPKFTYIVVNKRINTRFFSETRNEYQNPKPGLVVDDIVTRPERYDFFLVSQVARQGCVSPTYYNVLHDESGLPPERLQKLTYKFCHLYFNWTGTVAVPATCQNAHKLALLAGTALKGRPNSKLDYLLHFL